MYLLVLRPWAPQNKNKRKSRKVIFNQHTKITLKQAMSPAAYQRKGWKIYKDRGNSG